MRNDQWTIFLVCPEFPPVVTGGGGYVYEYLADEFSKSYDLVVLAADYTQSTIKEFSEGKLTIIPIPLMRLKGDPPELIARMPPTPRALFRLLKIVMGTIHHSRSRRQIANLHGVGHPVVDILGFLFWLVRVPFVVTVHGLPGSQSQTMVSLFYRTYERFVSNWILARAGAVISISTDIQRTLIKRRIPSHIVTNAIRLGDSADNTTALCGRRRQLLCVGRLATDKGFQYAIWALDKLSVTYPDLTLRILGDDFGAKGELIRSVPEGIRHKVVFGGRVHRDVVLREMSSALAVLIPSLQEPFGLVALEALSVGAVVIASRSGALPEIIQHGQNGLLVDPQSADSLADAVLRVLNDKQLERLLRRNGPARAREFSTETAAATYLDIFRGVIHQHIDSPEPELGNASS